MNFKKFCFVTAILALAAARPASAACTNATLNGVWGFQVGTAVGLLTADGQGSLTGSQTVNQNGTILTQTFSGVYSVAKNCTGSVTFNVTGGGSGTANFVFDEAKKGFQIIDTISGLVAEGIGLVRGTVTCGLTGKKTTYAAEVLGKINGTGPVGYVFQAILDGNGNVTGTGTFDVNGAFTTGAISGKYTQNADCTGTLEIQQPQPEPSLNFSTVVVNSGKEILLVETDASAAAAGNMQK